MGKKSRMKAAAREAKARAATVERRDAMSLRDNLVVVVEDFRAKAADAADRKSWIEANTYRAACNEVRAALGMPLITDWNGQATG